MDRFWPDEWCELFKSTGKFPGMMVENVLKPVGAKIVAFPGVPNPPEARDACGQQSGTSGFIKRSTHS